MEGVANYCKAPQDRETHPQVMSYYEALPKDLFEESEDDEPPPQRTRQAADTGRGEQRRRRAHFSVTYSKICRGRSNRGGLEERRRIFSGARRGGQEDSYSIQYTTTATLRENVSVARIRPLVRIDEERIRSVVRRVPLEKREAVLREAIKRVEASLPPVASSTSKGDLPIHSGDEFASIVAKGKMKAATRRSA